ncbi:hypothetical protein DLJ61_25415 [Gordonia terrae]|uniref:Uncharacterized protein n=1 Tax=Gordonia terrae TaxID=2055 RepID=A0AAD0KBH9_9ACTN|nr:hypothetical protein DLJ61_25415 [Gordonia terrae]
MVVEVPWSLDECRVDAGVDSFDLRCHAGLAVVVGDFEGSLRQPFPSRPVLDDVEEGADTIGRLGVDHQTTGPLRHDARDLAARGGRHGCAAGQRLESGQG